MPGIKQVSLGNQPLSSRYSSTAMEYNGPDIADPINQIVFKKEVNTKYIVFYGLKLLAGTNLSISDTTNGYVINETATKEFGFKNPHDAIGKIVGQKGAYFPIIGVVQDFHAKDFYNPIEQLALLNGSNSNTYNIRIEQGNLRITKSDGKGKS